MVVVENCGWWIFSLSDLAWNQLELFAELASGVADRQFVFVLSGPS